jgi:hypothetical protein
VDGKFRIADQVVAEDSKDYFFAAPKPRYGGYEIVKIQYEPGFQKATVVTMCDGEWTVRGQRMKIKMSVPSSWKIENGEWFWYVVPKDSWDTPFGTMHAGAAPAEQQSAQAAAAAMLRDPAAAARSILESVRADKKELMLSSYEKSSGEVVITNGMQGAVRLRADVDGQFPGLSFTLDKTEVPAGEKAILKIVCEPRDKAAKPTLTARIFVEPTGQVIPVSLFFAIPPEIEKQIPKEARPKLPAQ